MSNLEDLYNKSTGPRIKEARQIPSIPPNFVDQQHQFLKKFEINEKPGDPSEFTDTALNYFDTELNQVITPPGFSPTTPFNQFNPKNPYNVPGAPGAK